MIRFLILVGLIIFGNASLADIVVASRIIPANTVITADDLRLRPSGDGTTEIDLNTIVGMETRVALFAGRPIAMSDVGVPAVVERNQVIPLIFQSAGLEIKTDGRVLDRAGPGESVKVMNLSSRTIVFAHIDERGVGYVEK